MAIELQGGEVEVACGITTDAIAPFLSTVTEAVGGGDFGIGMTAFWTGHGVSRAA